MNSIQTANIAAATDKTRDPKIWKSAQTLESNFIAEMLKSAGFGKPRESFGGGVGEDQFSSFLIHEYAEATVAVGGIGLAESIYKSIVSREGLSK